MQGNGTVLNGFANPTGRGNAFPLRGGVLRLIMDPDGGRFGTVFFQWHAIPRERPA